MILGKKKNQSYILLQLAKLFPMSDLKMVKRNKSLSLDINLINAFQQVIDKNSRIRGNFSRSIEEHMIAVVEEDKMSVAVEEKRYVEIRQKGLVGLGIDWILDYKNYANLHKIQDSLSQEENEQLTYALKKTSEEFVARCPSGKYRPQHSKLKVSKLAFPTNR